MEKSKPKGKPNHRKWIIPIGIIAFLMLLVWAFTYYISPGHSLSDFSRFETSEEVVAFLHDNFDLNVTTSDEIRTFMEAYPLEYDSCHDNTPRPGHFEGYVVDENVINIISCTVPEWGSLAGTSVYHMYFYIDTNDQLAYISASWGCWCL